MKITQKVALLAGCALATMSVQAYAQEAAGSDDAAVENGDIIVTAQRKDTSLSRTPVAVSVVSADMLADANVKTEDDLRVLTPGLSIRSTLSSNQLNYALRGQSKDAFTSGRPGVLPYINEVQIGGDGASLYYDLSSVQTLKGPQGTLFGRSATGGAVLLATQKPTDEFGGYVSGLIGNYNHYKIEGAINVPLAGDQLMARISGVYQNRDGFQFNDRVGRRVGKLDRYGLRGSVSGDFGGIRNDLVLDYFKSDSENTVPVLSGLVPFTNSLVPIELVYAGTATPVARATGIAVGQAFLAGAPQAVIDAYPAFYDAFFADPNHPSTGLRGFLATQTANGAFRISSGVANFYKAENYVVTNNTEVDLSDNVKLRNIFGYVNQDSTQALPVDATPYDINTTQPPGGGSGGYRLRTKQVSNELQLQGSVFDDRLDFVTGFYFSDEDQQVVQSSFPFTILFGGSRTDQDFTVLNKTLAGYGQATFKLNDSGLSVTAGARYTSEKVGLRIGPQDGNYARAVSDPAFSEFQERTYNRLSWQFGIQDQVTSDLLLYAVTRRAYKSGGFNGSTPARIGFAEIGGNGFRDERVTDVEGGVKYNGRVAGSPIRASLALYHNWIENAQRASYTLVAGAPASITVNVPKGKAFGGEFEFTASPAPWLTTGVALSYIDFEYSGTGAGVTAIAGCNGATVNSNTLPQCYDQFPDTPKYSANAFVDFTVPVSGSISGILHADVYTQSDSYTYPNSANNFDGGTIKSYAIVNLRAGITDDAAGWSLMANVKNLGNNRYFVGGVGTGLLYQINTLLPGEPRTFTVEARYKF